MRRKWTPTKTFELRDYSPVLLGVARVDLIFSWSGLSLSCKSERVQRRAESKEEPAPYPAKSFVLSKRHDDTRHVIAELGWEEKNKITQGEGWNWDEMKWRSRAARSSLLMDWFAWSSSSCPPSQLYPNPSSFLVTIRVKSRVGRRTSNVTHRERRNSCGKVVN